MSGKQMVCVLYSGKEHKNTGVWGHLAWPTQPNLVTKLSTQTKADPKFCQRVYFMHHDLLKSFYWVSIAGEFYCLKKSNSLDQMRLEQDLGGDGGGWSVPIVMLASPPKGERRSPQHLFRPRHTLDGAKMRASVRMTRYLESWGAAKPFAHLHHRDSMTTENGKISTTVCLPWSHGHGGSAESSYPSKGLAISTQNHACQQWGWPLSPWLTKWINQALLSLMENVWYLDHLRKVDVKPQCPAHGHC